VRGNRGRGRVTTERGGAQENEGSKIINILRARAIKRERTWGKMAGERIQEEGSFAGRTTSDVVTVVMNECKMGVPGTGKHKVPIAPLKTGRFGIGDSTRVRELFGLKTLLNNRCFATGGKGTVCTRTEPHHQRG